MRLFFLYRGKNDQTTISSSKTAKNVYKEKLQNFNGLCKAISLWISEVCMYLKILQQNSKNYEESLPF